ncbi:MAG: alpha-L-fucosidase [Flavitalea sp.]
MQKHFHPIFSRFIIPLIVSVQLMVTSDLNAQKKYEANWESIDSRPIPTWFEDSKFGIFIHWGLYSVPSWAPTGPKIPTYSKYAEWYGWRMHDKDEVGKLFMKYHTDTYGKDFKYNDFVKDFKAELFSPDQWAELLKESGAKYVVLTSKHHEGFAMWPSQHSWNWNAMDVGPHRDLAGDLIKAVKGKGLRMGFYYSLYEWFNPLYKTDVNRYVDEHMIPQMKDLVTRYNPDLVWTDGEWDHPSEVWKSTSFLSWLYNESPVKNDVVVNDRWGKETRSKHGSFYTTEYDLVHNDDASGKLIAHPWEECRGIGGSFGYNRNENLEDYSSSKEVIQILIDKVARGGNLLLNIGPTADGRIPVIMQQRLKDIGSWLKVNGDAIYNTRAWDKAPAVKKETTLFFSKKGSDLYAMLTDWNSRQIVIDGVKKPVAVELLGYKGKVNFSYSGGKLTITPPSVTPDANPSQWAWAFKLKNAL